MTERWDGFENILGAQGGRVSGEERVESTWNRSLTVPLLCCRCGFEVEGVHEVEGGFAQTQLMQCGPQVDHVALALAVGIEALELVQHQVHAEGSAPAIATMDRAGAASLRAWPLEPRRQPQVIEQARHGQLGFDMGEVEPDAR